MSEELSEIKNSVKPEKDTSLSQTAIPKDSSVKVGFTAFVSAAVSPSGALWAKWFELTGEHATPEVINATATLVVNERDLGKEAERELCAQVVEGFQSAVYYHEVDSADIAAAIRATTQETKSSEASHNPSEAVAGFVPHGPKCTCFAVDQHATYCPREGMDFDSEPSTSTSPEGGEVEDSTAIVEWFCSANVRIGVTTAKAGMIERIAIALRSARESAFNAGLERGAKVAEGHTCSLPMGGALCKVVIADAIRSRIGKGEKQNSDQS